MEQAKILQVNKEDFPPLRFIGKRYTDQDRDPASGGFEKRWEDALGSDFFQALSGLAKPEGIEEGPIGLEGYEGGEFEYWIGGFFEQGSPVPQGYASVDFPAFSAGVCWICGKEPGIYWMPEYAQAEVMEEYDIVASNARWVMFERYNPSRFLKPDADGNIILDLGIFLQD